jgi:hypothetical protein
LKHSPCSSFPERIGDKYHKHCKTEVDSPDSETVKNEPACNGELKDGPAQGYHADE